MYTLTVVETISLDGVVQSPGRPDEDTRGGFDLGGWAVGPMAADPEAATAAMSGRAGGTAAMLFGRRSYDDLLGHWTTTPETNPFAEVLVRTPKFVASRTGAPEPTYPNSTLLVGDAAQTVAAVKHDGDGELVVIGSISLVRDLAAAGLVDQLILTVVPVVVGRGTRLFDGVHVPLEVTASSTSRTGIVTATYAVRSP